jgi:hypothetical protein
VYVVDPRGRVRACKVAKGLNHHIVDSDGNVRPQRLAEGFVLLEHLYAEQGPEGGMAVFMGCQRAAGEGQIAVLDDGWWPPEVLRRREAAAAPRVWECPPPPPPRVMDTELGAVEVVHKRRAKRGADAAGA